MKATPLTDWRLKDDNPNEWVWTPRAQRRHDLSSWLPVQVPMGVQEALLKARRIGHPYNNLNSRAAEWVEHRDWIYGVDFDLAPPPVGRRTFIEFEAVADSCLLFLNGTLVGEHEGPGARFDFEIGPLLRAEGNQMFLVVRSPRQEDPQTGWTDATRSLRGRMGFGWDFAPRLLSLGILGEVNIIQTGEQRLRDLWARPRLSDDLSSATVALSVRVDGPPGARVRFGVVQEYYQARTVDALVGDDAVASAEMSLEPSLLWWPNGMGEQPLSSVWAECLDGSTRIANTFALRDVRWEVRPGGAANEWPLMLVVNGRRVFQRGWNWVPADAMGGPRSLRLMRRLLRLAADSGANIIRCWGGADPESAAFYQECDRLGLLVWQEFPLSSAGISNTPPDDPAYLERMARYARRVVIERRNHPSLALWGGGNELTDTDGKPLSPAHPYAGTLAAVIAELDPDRAFRPSSPLGPNFDADPQRGELWDVHGPWEYGKRQPGPQYSRFNGIEPALHSETGAPGLASMALQRRYLTPLHRGRGNENPAWRHHGGAWWDHEETLRALFGAISDDALAVMASQWLQAETVRYSVEATRRRWPRSGGIYPWQLNEPWPNVACTSAVEYGGRVKQVYYAVRDAYRPVFASARYDALTIAPGEPLRAELWGHNDGPELATELIITLRDPDGRVRARKVIPATLPAAAALKLHDLELALAEDWGGLAVLELLLAGATSRYAFARGGPEPLRPLLDYPQLMTFGEVQ